MNVIFDGELYKVARITGPTHNYLALEVNDEVRSEVVPVALSLNESAKHVVTADLVKKQVMDAVAEFNATYETTYGVKRAQFVVSDTLQPTDIYKRLALEVLRYVHQHGRA